MTKGESGRLRARMVTGAEDLARALALRSLVFRAGAAEDRDSFDARCGQVVIEDGAGRLLATFRMLSLPQGEIESSYSAQFYDLAALRHYPGPVLELGRFCVAPGVGDPDVLRLAFGVITRAVDAGGVTLLCGCSSFAGADPARHAGALAALRDRTGPLQWRPRARREAVAFGAGAGDPAALPPLLRSYLALGAWVSDHAVQDTELDTLHVFTAIETNRIAPARARALRALAQAV